MLRGTSVNAREDECDAITGRAAGHQRLVEGAIGDVRNVDHHAQPVHLAHHLAPEIGDAVMMLDLFVVEITAGVAQFVGVRPSERHVAHAEAVIIAQNAHVALDRVPALDAQQRGQLVLAMRGQNVLGAEGHHHLVGVQPRLLVHGVNHVERALDLLPLEGPGVHPNGEELRAQVAGFDLVEVQVTGAGVLREIEVFVHEAAWRVGVGVNDERRVVDGARTFAGA